MQKARRIEFNFIQCYACSACLLLTRSSTRLHLQLLVRQQKWRTAHQTRSKFQVMFRLLPPSCVKLGQVLKPSLSLSIP
jgi:hypothetical protein